MNAPTKSFMSCLAESAIAAHLARLGATWRDVSRTLQQDFEIELNDYPQEFEADHNPLATWAQRQWPNLNIGVYDSELIAYLKTSDEELVVQLPEPVHEFMRRWITNTWCGE